MLNIDLLQEIYDEMMRGWLQLHAEVYAEDIISYMVCDKCQRRSQTGRLHSVGELLVCEECLLSMWGGE